MKIRSKYPVVLSLAALAQPGIASAAESTAPEKLEEVTVFGKNFVPPMNSSGTKSATPPLELPASLSVISRDLLDSWNAGKLTEALRYTPGVNAEPFGLEPRFTSLNMRGFTSTGAGIYRDGLALVNPGSAVSYNLEPYGAERVEVPRGPSSVLYGRASPGGLVNFVSKVPKKETFGEVGLELGNHDRKKGEFDFGSATESGTLSYRLTGLFQAGETQVDFIEDDRRFLAAAGRWDISENTSLTLLGSYQYDETKDSQALPADGFLTPNPNGVVPINRFTGEPAVDDYHRNEGSGGYQFEHRFSDSVRFFQNARYNHVSLTEAVVYSNGLRPDRRTVTRSAFWLYGDLDGLTVDNQLHWSFSTGPLQHRVLVGLDYQDIASTRVQHTAPTPIPLDIFEPVYGTPIPRPAAFANDDLDLTQLGLYLQDEVKFGEKVILNLGLRYDEVDSETYSHIANRKTQDQKDDNLTTRAGLVYMFDSGFAPYISYSESFLPSTGLDAFGNPFEPEEGSQVEVGVKYQPKSFNGLFTLAMFDLTRKNFVSRSQTTLQLEQTGEGRSKGVEFEAFSALDNGLSYIASYTYLDTEQTVNANPALIGKEFTQIPEHKAALWVDYNFDALGFDDFGIGAGVRYQSSTYSDTLNTVQSPEFTVYDAAIHYQWNNMRFGLNVQNLADKEYVSSCFMRNSLLCTVGETRSIKATVRYRW